MAQLERADLHGEIEQRFRDNDTGQITPLAVREFLHEFVDSALLAASDSFDLSKWVTLAQARAQLAFSPPTAQAGQLYAIAGPWNGAASSTVYVQAISNRAFHVQGVLFAGGIYSPVTVDVVAGTAVVVAPYQPIPQDYWGTNDPPQLLATVNEALEYLHGPGGTPAPVNTTPAKPNWVYLSASRSLSLMHSTLAPAELEYSHDGGFTWVAYTGKLTIDNAAHDPGEYVGRVKASTGRNVSGVALSPAIAPAAITNTAPTATITVAGGLTTATPGQSLTLQVSGQDADVGDSVSKLDVFDNGVKIGSVTGASGNLQTAGLTVGSHNFTAQATDTRGASGAVSAAAVVTVQAAVGYDGRKVQIFGHGDSRTKGYPDGTSPWPDTLPSLLNQNAGTGKYDAVNGGQVGQGSDFALAAVNGYLLSKRDTTTYWRQLIIVWFGVNDQLHNPSWTAQQTIDNLAAVHKGLRAAGFYTLAVTEPISGGWDPDADIGGNWGANADSKAKRLAINAAIRAKAVIEWGAFDVADIDTLVAIQNMADKSISPDGLHYTPATDATILAPFFAGYVNKWAAAMGVPTSATPGGGGAITPSAPAIAEAGRTLTAAAGNGLPASTLRYKIKNGADVVGSTYTVPVGDTLQENDIAFYSVATGNYLRSPFAYNKNSYAAVYTAILRNSNFTSGPVSDELTGWRISNQVGSVTPKVAIGGGICEFKGVLYDYIQQQTTNLVVGKTYRITLVVDSMSGGDLILKTNYVNTINKRFSTAQTITLDFVAGFTQEGFNLGAEGNTVAVISFFDIQPVV